MRSTDAQIVNRALALLRAGILASALPNLLIEEFGLTPERARELGGTAIRRWRKQEPPRVANGGRESTPD